MQKKIILWLEDLLETIEEPFNYAESLGFTIEPASTFVEFLDILDDHRPKIAGIILDVMMIGVNDLSPYSSRPTTGKGSETGWIVLEKFICDENNECMDIPILMYSARDLTTERQNEIQSLKDNNKLDIAYLEKSLEHKPLINRWIKNLAKNA